MDATYLVLFGSLLVYAIAQWLIDSANRADQEILRMRERVEDERNYRKALEDVRNAAFGDHYDKAG